METTLLIDEQPYVLEQLLSQERSLITLGRQSDKAYNVIAIDDEGVDTFQCQLSLCEAGWKIQHGQWRTECPKGIRSRLQHACSLCMGRCVNTRPAHPTYSWRMPEKVALVNGTELTNDGVLLQQGDMIALGCKRICVNIKNTRP